MTKFNSVLSISFLTALSLLVGCGTVYTPQVLTEARGVARTEGQEKLVVSVIPLTSKVIREANEDDYIRRVVDAGDLSRAARLISVDQAINQRAPKEQDPGPYRLGIGDGITISQKTDPELEIGNTNRDPETLGIIAKRELFIADDGFASVLGIGRVSLAGLTQFEAEEKIYKLLVAQQKNPDFELYISAFNSQKIYLTNLQNDLNKSTKPTNLTKLNYSNLPFYLHQIIDLAGFNLELDRDAVINIKRNKEVYRLSARDVITGKTGRIRLWPEDKILIKPIPYRPETAIIMGEVINPRLFNLSPSSRSTLSEALYSDSTFDPISSDTSQIYLLRSKNNKNIKAYHLDASNPSRLLLAGKIELRPNDIIFIAPQPITNYNRAFIQIFGAYAMTVDPRSVAKDSD